MSSDEVLEVADAVVVALEVADVATELPVEDAFAAENVPESVPPFAADVLATTSVLAVDKAVSVVVPGKAFQRENGNVRECDLPAAIVVSEPCADTTVKTRVRVAKMTLLENMISCKEEYRIKEGREMVVTKGWNPISVRAPRYIPYG